jgi:hypothetical protein
MNWCSILKSRFDIYYREGDVMDWKQWDKADDRLNSRAWAFGALRYENRNYIKGKMVGNNEQGLIFREGKPDIMYVILSSKAPAPGKERKVLLSDVEGSPDIWSPLDEPERGL